jgi:hypothetical protein
MWQETIRRCLLNIHKKMDSNDNKKYMLRVQKDGIADISSLMLLGCNERARFIH